MSNFSLHLTDFFPLVSLALIIFLGVFVLRKGRQLTLHRLFFAVTIVFAVWEFGTFMMFVSRSDYQIIFWDRFVYLGVVFVPAIQYHFSLAATFYNRRRRALMWLAYALSICFLLLSRTPYFVDEVFHYQWGAHTRAQLGHHFFLAFFFFYIFAFLYNFIHYRWQSKDRKERVRAVYYVIAFAFLNLVGALAYLPAYGIAVYPVALISPIVFCVLITYAIVYYQLLDVKFIMRRYLVYALSFVSILIPVAIWLNFFYQLFPRYLVPAYFFLLFLSLLAFPPLKDEYYKLSNKYFFSSLYDVQELIYNLNSRLRASLDVGWIFRSMANIVMPAFHSRAMAALGCAEDLQYWPVLYNNGFHCRRRAKMFLDYHTLNLLFAAGRPLTVKSINKSPDRQFSHFLNRLGKLPVDVIVPISLKKKLSYLLFLGAKESGESYNKQDLAVLETVGVEISIALENALLYQRVKRFNVKLKREIKKATAQLQEKNEMLQKLDKTKDEFISIASHQLRMPLTSIRWFTELLAGNKSRNLTAEQQEFLRQIATSNRKMIRLVDDLLDVSHIETGRKFTLVKKNLPVNDLIKEAVAENLHLLTTRRLRLINDVPADLAVYADPDKLRQVWQNLLSNATKYGGQRKQIHLAASLKPSRVIFSVQDHGIGIPLKQQPRLFEKFFRAANAALRDPDGTGLGLYIAREIVRAHGGELWLKSAENKGSTFYFSLPRKGDHYLIEEVPRTAVNQTAGVVAAGEPAARSVTNKKTKIKRIKI
ncbi:MAG: ATP-binding protein [Patescibacteria group bacterium]